MNDQVFVAACMPWDRSVIKAELRKLHPSRETKALLDRCDLPYYEGAVKSVCADCKESIEVGPRIQAKCKEMEVTLLCLFCAARSAQGYAPPVVSLGNRRPGE